MTLIGSCVGGKYRVLAKLGEGGMGAVFRAENVITGRHVALKCLHPQLGADHEAAERLLREARATAHLEHPNVVDVYDVVQDQGRLFLVMNLLHGETLRAYLARNPRPAIHEIVRLLLPVLDAVAAAHALGIIHRDLKPENIFLATSPGAAQITPKVLDFGVAKFTAQQGATLTETGMAIGTPLYMAVEQLRGDKDVDARVDVYAFGVMLYEAITGRPPFTGATLPELVIKVATTDAAPIASLRPDVPVTLAHSIDSAIARDRSQRPADLHVLIRALEPFAHPSSSVMPPSAAASVVRSEVVTPAPERDVASAPATRRSPRVPSPRSPWALAAAVVLLLGGVMAFDRLKHAEPPAAAASSSSTAAPVAVEESASAVSDAIGNATPAPLPAASGTPEGPTAASSEQAAAGAGAPADAGSGGAGGDPSISPPTQSSGPVAASRSPRRAPLQAPPSSSAPVPTSKSPQPGVPDAAASRSARGRADPQPREKSPAELLGF